MTEPSFAVSLSRSKCRLFRISYETWHLTHLLGFVVVCVLATLHITSVGRHVQFNLLWWGLCTMSVGLVLYNQLVKKAQPEKDIIHPGQHHQG